MMALIRKYLLSGLLVWLPLWITLLALHFLVSIMDQTLNLIPEAFQPDRLLGFHIPGLGVIFTLLVLFFTGMLVTNVIGSYLLNFWNALIARIPLVRSLYVGVQKTIETMFKSKGQAFRKVLLVQYPREGLWSIAFLTGSGCQSVESKTDQEMISIFVPTTPNPTSGFLILVPKQDVIELDLTIDEALKMVISLGVVQPNGDEKPGLSH